jgi:hypothetical protein
VADRLVRAGAEERLLPLLFEGDSLPALVRDALDRASAWRRLFSLRAATLDRTIVRVGEILRGEPYLFLKGADYRYRIYPRTWLRPMQDIDVLVPAARADAVTRQLEEIGLPRRFPGGPMARLASYHERVFDLGDVTLEVHHSFVQRIRYRVDYEGVWARRAPLSAGPLSAQRLGDADALLYHAVSFANDEFAVPLIRFVDFWLLCRANPDALAEATDRAPSWRAGRALYGALRQTGRVFPEFETEAVRRTRTLLLSAPSRWFLDRAVLPRADERLSSKLPRSRQLWRKFWLIPGFPRRAAFAVYYLYALLKGAWLARNARGA